MVTVLGWILFGLALWTVVAVVVVIPVCRVLGRRSRDYPAADKGSAWQAWQGRATRARMLLYRFCYGDPIGRQVLAALDGEDT